MRKKTEQGKKTSIYLSLRNKKTEVANEDIDHF